ncbi:MAG TPA: hypothetical protein PL182_00935 [Pseudobdellovibrionaceae bacterium]|mgnify:CR=1 FL=1|nr:hypothetical protein [Pseudobdellovibrionaceae bacterium]
MRYPHDGQFYPASEKKFSEVVFFVPFFEGTKEKLRRHVQFVNDLGYDAFAFTLQDNFSVLHPPISSRKNFGFKHLYADQIEELLNMIPGNKIVFAFSNPGAAAIEALSWRKCQDIKALICDSGPSGKFKKSARNLYGNVKTVGPFPVLWLLTQLFSYVWSAQLHADVEGQLRSFPKDFPVLSIRGWKDAVIPPDHIDVIFDPQTHLDLQKLALPEAGHLNGLRDFGDLYRPAVARFLASVSTPLS